VLVRGGALAVGWGSGLAVFADGLAAGGVSVVAARGVPEPTSVPSGGHDARLGRRRAATVRGVLEWASR